MQFEQSQSIVSRIQQILREYPYGDAVLLELLQNADDAGANRVHMHLDTVAPTLLTTTVASRGSSANDGWTDVFHKAIAAQEAPALVFFNSSVFTERDLNNIQSIGGTTTDSKRHDGTKVGRFGLGFNSAYHMADVIAFVSKQTLIVFDPCREFLPPNPKSNGGMRTGGYRWNFVEETKRIEEVIRGSGGGDDESFLGLIRQGHLTELDVFFLKLMELFERPYYHTNTEGRGADTLSSSLQTFSRRASFEGTVFRLPLRQKPSQLWREIHTVEKLESLVANFHDTGSLGLVLTKHVCGISASVSSSSPAVVAAQKGNPIIITSLFTLHSTGASPSVTSVKKQYLQWLETYTKVMGKVAALTDSQDALLGAAATASAAAKLIEELPQPEAFNTEISITLRRILSSSSSSSDDDHVKTTIFNVSHFFGPGGGWHDSGVWRVAEECARYHHPISVPWAASIIENGASFLRQQQQQQLSQHQSAATTTAAAISSSSSSVGGGRMICFFPIRQGTGLPVHLHGYFQLSSDRQSVTGVDKSRWNAALCGEVVPFAYANSILHRRVTDPVESPLHLWPMDVYTDPTVLAIAGATLDLLVMQRSIPVRAAAAGGGGGVVATTTTGAAASGQPTTTTTTLAYHMSYQNISKVVFPCCCNATPSSSSSASSSSAMDSSNVTPEAYRVLVAMPLSIGELLYLRDPEDEMPVVQQLVTALRRAKHSVRVMDAGYCRKVLLTTPAPTSEAIDAMKLKCRHHHHDDKGNKEIGNGTAALPNEVVLPLLNLCLSDGQYEAFVKCRAVATTATASGAHEAVLGLIPLSRGFGGRIADALLYAPTQLWSDVVRSLPSMRDRLVLFMEGGDPPQLQSSSSSSNIAVVDAARRHLQRLKDMRVLAILNAARFAVELQQVMLPRIQGCCYRRRRCDDSAEEEWVLEVPSLHDRTTTAGSTSAKKDSVTSSAASRPPPCLHLSVPALRQLLMETFDAQYYLMLSLLPALNASDVGGDGDVRRCICATDEENPLCVAYDDSGEEEASLHHRTCSSAVMSSMLIVYEMLCAMGATAIDSTVLGTALLSRWREDSTAAGGKQSLGSRVVVLSASSAKEPQSVADVLWALRQRIQADRTLFTRVLERTVLPSSSRLSTTPAPPPPPTNGGDALRRYAAQMRAVLTTNDVSFVSSLPIYRTIWNTFVAVKNNNQQSSSPSSSPSSSSPSLLNTVFLVSPRLSPSPAVGDTIKRSLSMEPFHVASLSALVSESKSQPLSPATIDFLSRLSLIFQEDDGDDADNRDEVAFLHESLRVPLLPDVAALALAACRLPPPTMSMMKPESMKHIATNSDAVNADQDAAAAAAVWTQLFSTMHQLHKDKASLTDAARCALELLSRTAWLPTLASHSSTPIPPAEIVVTTSPEMCILLLTLESERETTTSMNTSLSPPVSSLVPRVACVDVIPRVHCDGVLEMLNIPRSVDGDSLVELVRCVAVRLSRGREMRASGAAATKQSLAKTFLEEDSNVAAAAATSPIISSNTSQQEEHRKTISSASVEEQFVYVAALLDALERSKSLSKTQWESIAEIRFIPISVRRCDDDDDDTDEEENSGGGGYSEYTLSSPRRVCLEDVYRLSPIGPRGMLHPLLVKTASVAAAISSSSSSSSSASSSSSSSVFLNLASRFQWNQPPPLRDVLQYVESVSSSSLTSTDLNTSTATTLSKKTREVVDVTSWAAVMDHIERQLEWCLASRNNTTNVAAAVASVASGGGGSGRGGGFVDPFVYDKDCLNTVTRSCRRMYFPERRRSLLISQLALDPQAESCYPYLASIDRTTAARYPSLWKSLGVVEKHTVHTILSCMSTLIEEAAAEVTKQNNNASLHVDPTTNSDAATAATATVSSSRAPLRYVGVVMLSDARRQCYTKLIEYAIAVDANAVRDLCSQSKGLLLPTADGSVNWGCDVSYSVMATTTATTVAAAAAAPAAPAAPSSSGGTPLAAAEQLDDKTLLHASISNHVARALGVKHTGYRFLAQMNAKYARNTFRARGQRQSVVNSIRRILGDYSDQQSILMEMIQNADDALASEVIFTLDHRSFVGASDVSSSSSSSASEGLLGKEMGRCQGPALVAYNDKMFTPADFDALLEIGCGHKAKDQLSIGRFGVGFNSVYHMTDCPVIVSGDYTLFLDPSAAHIDSATPEAPGVMICHTEEPNLLVHFPQQFAPFDIYNASKFRSSFNGTLIRLPLRTKPWEKSIGSAAWTPLDALRVLRQFEALLPHVLLFLKSVQKITLREVHVDGSVRVLSSVAIQDPSGHVTEYREDVRNFAAVQHPSKPVGVPLHATCVMPLVLQRSSSSGNTDREGYSSSSLERMSWLISSTIQSIASGPQLNCDPELRRKLLPWGSVAILLAPPSPSSSTTGGTTSNTTRDGESTPQQQLRFLPCPSSMVHCFLPLPCQRGELPFHTHGCFALTSDRRGMWTHSLGSEESWEAQWNRFVATQVIGDAAARAFVVHGLPSPSTSAPLLEDGSSSRSDAAAAAAYFKIFPMVSTQQQGERFDAVADGSTPSGSNTNATLLQCVSNGFYTTVVSEALPILWTAANRLASPGRVCCKLIDANAPTSVNNRSLASLPFRLSNETAALVLTNKELCVLPSFVYHGLLAAALELKSEIPTEMNPLTISRELFQRAGSSSHYCVQAQSLFPSLFSSSIEAATTSSGSRSSVTTRKAPPPPPAMFAILAELTLYCGQCNDPALLEGVPLVLLRDGTVGVVKHGDMQPNAHVSDRGGDHRTILSSNRNLFVAPQYQKDVERLFPAVPVVDEKYYDAVMQRSRKPNEDTVSSSSLSTGSTTASLFGSWFSSGDSATHSRQHQTANSSSVNPTTTSNSSSLHIFTPERWAALLGVESLHLKAISVLFHLHARSQTQQDIPLGVPLPVDNRFHDNSSSSTETSSSRLRQWCKAFWSFVRKSDSGAALLDASTLAQCGDLDQWPLIPAKRSRERALLPMSLLSQLACGSTNAVASGALEHLGVWILDTEFDEWQTIRLKCNVVDVEGQQIGDLLSHAVTAGRFNNMSNTQRDHMLQWLLACNQQQRGLFRSVFGGTGPMVQSIRRLPLFSRYDANTRSWKYDSIPDVQPGVPDSMAAPVELSLGAVGGSGGAATAGGGGASLCLLCHNMYQTPIPDLNLNAMPISTFLSTKVQPAMQLLETNRDVLGRQHSGGGAGGGILTPSEELEFWKLLARYLDPSLKSLFQKTSFVPGERNMETVRQLRAARRRQQHHDDDDGRTQNTSNSLRQATVEWLADTDASMALRTLEARRCWSLAAMLRIARHDHLDRSRRFIPLDVVRPYLCASAPVPNVLALLMQVKTECFSKMMCPAVLWEDGTIQQLLTDLGVSPRLSRDVLVEAALALAAICNPSRRLLSSFLTANGLDQATHRRKFEFLRDVSWSLALTVLDQFPFGSSNASPSSAATTTTGGGGGDISEVAFVVPDPLTELPSTPTSPSSLARPGNTTTSDKGAATVAYLSAPKEMSAYAYRYCVWLHRPVLPVALSKLNQTKPPLKDVVSQLLQILDPRSVVSRSGDATLRNRVLSSVYSILAVEYRSEAAQEEAFRRESIYALPMQEPPVTTTTTTEGAEEKMFTFHDSAVAKLSQIVTLPASARIGSLRPHYFHAQEFEWCPSLASLVYFVHRQQPFTSSGRSTSSVVLGGVPAPSEVLGALDTYSDDQTLSGDALRVYCELLKLLVLSAAHHRLPFTVTDTWLSGGDVGGGDSSTTSESQTRKHRSAFSGAVRVPNHSNHNNGVEDEAGAPSSSSISLDRLRLPDASGRLLCLRDGICTNDQPSALRKIKPGSVPFVHQGVPLVTCRALRVPSIAQAILERVRAVHSISASTPIATTAAVKQTICCRLNVFFRSPLFVRVIHRLLATANLVGGGGGSNDTPATPTPPPAAGNKNTSNTQASSNGLLLLNPREVAQLRGLRVRIVDAVELSVVHRCRPTIDIGNEQHATGGGGGGASSSSVQVAYDAMSKTIFLCLGGKEVVHTHYLVSLMINNQILSRRLSPYLAALCCALQTITDGGGHEERSRTRRISASPSASSSLPEVVHSILDCFDCCDIAVRPTQEEEDSGHQHETTTADDDAAAAGGGLDSFLLCSFETSQGRLLPISTFEATHALAIGSVVDDLWMMKYAVTFAIPPGQAISLAEMPISVNPDGCSVAQPMPRMGVFDAETGLWNVSSCHSSSGNHDPVHHSESRRPQPTAHLNYQDEAPVWFFA